MSNSSELSDGAANKEKATTSKFADAGESNDDPCDKASIINALIKEYTELKAQIMKADERVQYWRMQEAKLSVSNWASEVHIKELKNLEAHVKDMYMERIEIDTGLQQKLKELKEARAKMWQDKWDNVQAEIAKYAKKLSSAVQEYSSENLNKDIAKYREESEKMRAENEELRKVMRDLEKKIGLDNLAANKDNLWSLATVVSELKTTDVRLDKTIAKLEGTLEELQHKVAECKQQLNNTDKSRTKSQLFQ